MTLQPAPRRTFRVGRRRTPAFILLTVLLCALTLTAGYVNKTRCVGPQFDSNGRSEPDYGIRAARDVCYSDIQYLWVGRDIDRHVFPYVNGGYDPATEQLFGGAVEYPVLTGMAIYLAAIPSSNDADFLAWSAVLLAIAGLITAALLAWLAGVRSWWFALAPPLVLYAFHNWDLFAVCATVVAFWALLRASAPPVRRRARGVAGLPAHNPAGDGTGDGAIAAAAGVAVGDLSSGASALPAGSRNGDATHEQATGHAQPVRQPEVGTDSGPAESGSADSSGLNSSGLDTAGEPAGVLPTTTRVVPGTIGRRGPLVLAAVALGIGGAFKLYPLMFVLPISLWLGLGGWRPGWQPNPRAALNRWLTAAAFAVGASAVFLVINLPFMLIGWRGWWASFQFQWSRPIDLTTNTIWFWAFRPHSDSANDVVQANLATAATVCTLASLLVACALGFLRLGRGRMYPWLPVCAAMICGYLLFNKVHSPQFALWLLPFFVLLRIRAGWILAYFVADAAIGIGFFRWQYLIGSGRGSGVYDAFSPQLVMIGVWGRVALLIGLFIVFLRAQVVAVPRRHVTGREVSPAKALGPERNPSYIR